MSADGVVVARRRIARFGEVNCGSTTEAAAMGVKRRDGLLQVRGQLRGRSSLHNVNLSVCAIANRLVFEPHVVGKNMDLSSLFWADVIWKDQDLARRVVSE